MALPVGAADEAALEEEQQTSRTYRLDIDQNRIVGMIDELDAVKQFVFKCLETNRFDYFIYDGDFGQEFAYGLDRNVFMAEIKRWVTEALMQDDRILGIENFQMETNGDTALLTFEVDSIYGSYTETRTVSIDV